MNENFDNLMNIVNNIELPSDTFDVHTETISKKDSKFAYNIGGIFPIQEVLSE